MLLEGTEGYRMGPLGNQEVIRTHSLFIDDLKVYQENHARLKVANETIVQASLDTGACYGVNKCAEIVFQRGKMIKRRMILCYRGEDESFRSRAKRNL